MGEYIKFADEQLAAANSVNLVDFMRRSGYRLKRSGSEYAWESPTGKVSIRGNNWYHQYEKIGGKAIGFLTRFHDMEFPDAVRFLLSEQGLSVPAEESEKPKERKPFELPPKNQDMRRIYAYLLNVRFLDREIVDYFVGQGLIYEDAEFHNVVFVGKDQAGVPRHAHKRSTGAGSSFKGNVSSSDDCYCFHYAGAGNKVFVFEAPIDMLAYLSMHKENWQENSYVTLCSAASEALAQFLKDNPQIKTIYSCLDHDIAGIEGYYRIAEEAGELGEYQVELIRPQYKDWDEELKAEHGIEPIPAQKHPGISRMKELCLELVGDWIDDPYPKYPVSQMNDQYNQLKRLAEAQTNEVLERSYALSGTAFLFVRKQLETMEIPMSEWELGKLLFSKYAPHRDHSAYRLRIVDIGERLQKLKKACGHDEIRTKSQMLEVIDHSLKLSVDCLRLCIYVEERARKALEEKEKQNESLITEREPAAPSGRADLGDSGQEGTSDQEETEIQGETEGELCLC